MELRIEIELGREIRDLLGINDDTVIESYVDGNRKRSWVLTACAVPSAQQRYDNTRNRQTKMEDEHG